MSTFVNEEQSTHANEQKNVESLGRYGLPGQKLQRAKGRKEGQKRERKKERNGKGELTSATFPIQVGIYTVYPASVATPQLLSNGEADYLSVFESEALGSLPDRQMFLMQCLFWRDPQTWMDCCTLSTPVRSS